MPIDRGVFDSSMDDSGAGTDGTILNKAWFEAALLDPVDAALLEAGTGNFGVPTELTIASGAVTVDGNYHSVDTEADAGTDDLATLNSASGVGPGHLLILKPENAARVVTLKDATGNLRMPTGDFEMDDADHQILFVREGSNWREIARNTGGSAATPGITTDGTRVQQIAFATSQSASADANTLDDYEEGAWTPVIGGSGGESGQAYNIQVGKYIKIGKLVWIAFFVQLSTKGTITSNVQIKGLPFPSENTANQYTTGVVTWSLLATNWVSINGQMAPNTSVLPIVGATAAAAGNGTPLTTTDLGNTSAFLGTFAYPASA